VYVCCIPHAIFNVMFSGTSARAPAKRMVPTHRVTSNRDMDTQGDHNKCIPDRQTCMQPSSKSREVAPKERPDNPQASDAWLEGPRFLTGS